LFNTYLCCEKYPQYSNGNFLFLCYKFQDTERYKKLEQQLIKQPNFIDAFEFNSALTVFIMEFNIKYSYIVQQFTEGKYHEFHPSVKKEILSFFNPSLNNNNLYNSYHEHLNDVLSFDVAAKLKLETELNYMLPEGMNFESKPLKQDETL
jgi:hypothetical protein